MTLSPSLVQRENVVKAKEEIENMMSEREKLVIAIAAEEASMIIGHGGSIIQCIKCQSGVYCINVKRNGEKEDAVEIVGTLQQINMAKELIHNILSQ